MHIYEVLITELHNENRGFYFEKKKKFSEVKNERSDM
jgi:hypothetical protein